MVKKEAKRQDVVEKHGLEEAEPDSEELFEGLESMSGD